MPSKIIGIRRLLSCSGRTLYGTTLDRDGFGGDGSRTVGPEVDVCGRGTRPEEDRVGGFTMGVGETPSVP